MILAVGPFTAWPAISGETATTGAAASASAARMPGTDSSGSMLRYGLDGQITIATRSGRASARKSSGDGRARSAPAKRIALTAGSQRRATK